MERENESARVRVSGETEWESERVNESERESHAIREGRLRTVNLITLSWPSTLVPQILSHKYP